MESQEPRAAGTPGPRRGTWLLRPAAALLAVAALATACGGGSPGTAGRGSGNAGSASSGSSTYQKALAYASCMRQHGVQNFPDPNSSGHFTLSGINPNSSQYQNAESACKSLAPFGNTSPAQKQTFLNEALKFARCMRSHGITNFPEPSQNSSGGVTFNAGSGSGVDTSSPQYQSAMQACRSDLPGGGTAGGAP